MSAGLELQLTTQAYTLSQDGQVLSRLAGGPTALLAGAGERLREADVEAAIERAEDWLMPSSKTWQQLELRVRDDAGALRAWLGAPPALSPEEVERAFSRAFNDVAFGRPITHAVLADLVVLRELVHHGAAPRVVFG